MKENISILVSLDGPKEIHDRYRVFGNNRGTFDVIMENIRRIEKYSREYFLNNLSFISVVTPPYDFDSIIDFFYRDDFFSPIKEKVTINFIDTYGTTFFEDFGLESVKGKFHKEFEKLLRRYKEALINGTFEKLTIEKQLFLEDFYRIVYRDKGELGKWFPPFGSCVPGKRRLFVNTEGKFFMCEKVNESYQIGDVDEGFNFQRICDFYKEYDAFFKGCKNCWALRLCNKCFDNIRKGEDFDVQRRENMCVNMKRNIENNLAVFCEIIEKNPQAFKVFQDIELV